MAGNTRKCTWTDFEIRSPWAEFVIESESPILMHGQILRGTPDIETILAPLRQRGIPFDAELYTGDNETLIRHWTTKPE